jgi:hypothetical protein
VAFGLLMALSGTAAAPFIYTLFLRRSGRAACLKREGRCHGRERRLVR